MMVWVASGGEALPLFHRDTVGRDALTMFATSEPLSPPFRSRSTRIFATAFGISALPFRLSRRVIDLVIEAHGTSNHVIVQDTYYRNVSQEAGAETYM